MKDDYILPILTASQENIPFEQGSERVDVSACVCSHQTPTPCSWVNSILMAQIKMIAAVNNVEKTNHFVILESQPYTSQSLGKTGAAYLD